jgi:hypothetical protein
VTPDQLAFVRIHQATSHDWVEAWHHVFQGALIRARTVRGKTASLARDAVQGLVDAGLMVPSYGGSFYLTEEGKRV